MLSHLERSKELEERRQRLLRLLLSQRSLLSRYDLNSSYAIPRGRTSGRSTGRLRPGVCSVSFVDLRREHSDFLMKQMEEKRTQRTLDGVFERKMWHKKYGIVGQSNRVSSKRKEAERRTEQEALRAREDKEIRRKAEAEAERESPPLRAVCFLPFLAWPEPHLVGLVYTLYIYIFLGLQVSMAQYKLLPSYGL